LGIVTSRSFEVPGRITPAIVVEQTVSTNRSACRNHSSAVGRKARLLAAIEGSMKGGIA
jgi:hypothetical protein